MSMRGASLPLLVFLPKFPAIRVGLLSTSVVNCIHYPLPVDLSASQ